jgi:hypothetical protein
MFKAHCWPNRQVLGLFPKGEGQASVGAFLCFKKINVALSYLPQIKDSFDVRFYSFKR